LSAGIGNNVSLKPGTNVRESLSARWLHARTARDFAAVEDLSLQLLYKYPRLESIRRSWARTLVALHRENEATIHWRTLLEANAHDREAANNLARGGRSNAYRFRHIAICGVSFCGSTVVDRLLGGLPAAANICESHWLTQMRSPSGHAPVEFKVSGAEIRYCGRCGPGCAVLNESFRQDLLQDAADWYAKIAERLTTSTLISADKNSAKLVDLDPLLRFDALVLFKSPAQAWMSARRRLATGDDGKSRQNACADYMTLWADRYTIFLDHFRPQGGVWFLHFDEFARDAVGVLNRICRALDLDFGSGGLEADPQGHPIGGNTLYANRAEIHVVPLAEPDCPDEELRLIAEAAQVQAVFGRLRERAEISLSR
jgi:hypothetical protein